MSDRGAGTRVLKKGRQDRLSTSVIPSEIDGPPAGRAVFKVWFIINRNGLLPPLVVELEDVPIQISN